MISALMVAGVALFLQRCYMEGMILHGYYKMIHKLPEWLNKPLGSCIYCQSVWLMIGWHLCKGWDPLLLIGQIGLNYIVVMLLYRYND